MACSVLVVVLRILHFDVSGSETREAALPSSQR